MKPKQTVYIEIDKDGNKFYYSDKKMTKPHRENGPAVIHYNGDKWWYKNGSLHNEKGPAVDWVSGTKYWYLNGQSYPESEWEKRVNTKKATATSPSCANKIVEIEGKKYKLTPC